MFKINHGQEVYIVDGNRTPFLKAHGKPGPFAAADLGVYAARELFTRLPLAPNQVGEVIAGCMIPSPDEANIARIIGLRLGCGKTVPGYTVQRNCASGMQALDCAFKDLKLGRHETVLAGGAEAMSRAPLIFNDKMLNWFADWMGAKSIGQRLKLITKIRPSQFVPIISLLRGLRDPVIGLSMGQTAENIAHRFNITREEMDEFALQSHARLAKAIDSGYFKNINTPIFDSKGQVYEVDDGLRRDSYMQKMAKLKPFFDKKYGLVTAANSSQVTDGAAFMLLASEAGVKKYNLPVLAKIVDVEWAGVAPEVMGMGPAHVVPPLLTRHNLKLSDIDYMEINEAFASQVLGCLRAWESDDYCRSELGLKEALGSMPLDRLNVDGGAVAIGHPVGASGARIVLQLVSILRRTQSKRGIATICIGGGQAGAVLIEI